MARPSLLNEELIKQFCEELEQGLPVKYVCDLLVITRRSYDNWMAIGENDVDNENFESIHAQFFLEIKKSQAKFIKKTSEELRKGEKNWTALAWWLERTRQEFMPSQRIEANDGGKVQVVIGGKVKQMKHDKQ